MKLPWCRIFGHKKYLVPHTDDIRCSRCDALLKAWFEA